MKRHYEPRERKPRIKPADYKPWTNRERNRLTLLVEAGNDNGYIATRLGRPRGDVVAEIKRLGIEAEFYEPDPMEAPVKKRVCLRCDKIFYHRTDHTCPNCQERAERIGGFVYSYRSEYHANRRPS
jgi:hypothetical protein